MKDDPIELMIVAAIAACTAITWAIRAVLVPSVALALTVAGWRPAAAVPAAGPEVSATALGHQGQTLSTTGKFVVLANSEDFRVRLREPLATSVTALRKQARKAGHPAAWCRTARKAELLRTLSAST